MCHISDHRYSADRWGRRAGPQARERTAQVATPTDRARDPDLRVSQAERDQVASALARHFADGRLTMEEYEERVEAALAARTGRDLDLLLTDLPRADQPTTPAHPGESRPEHRTRRRAGLLLPLAPVRVVAVAAVVVLAIATGPWALWLLWPALVLTGGCRPRYRHRAARAVRADALAAAHERRVAAPQEAMSRRP